MILKLNKILGNFSRNGNPSTGSLLTGLFNNQRDPETVLFLMKDEYTYTIVEANVIHNSTTEVCSISSYDFNFLKIAEDLSCIFVGTRKDYMESYKLYRCSYGKDYDFTKDKYDSIFEYQYASQYQIIGDAILISYSNKRGENHIGLFSEDEDLDIENEYGMYGCHAFSILHESNQVLAITRIDYSGPEIAVLDNNVDTNMVVSCSEHTQVRFEYPQVLFIKGGLELISYHLVTQNYTYIKLPCPIAIIKEDNKNTLSFNSLLDLGKYLVNAKIYHSQNDASLELNLNYILKNHMPKDKLLNLIEVSTMKYKGEKPEPCFILHFTNSVICYSAKELGRYEHKKVQHSTDEIMYYLGDVQGIIVFKKNTKKILLVKAPLDVSDKSSTEIIYESQDLIKSVKINYSNYTYRFLIVDEAKYLKVGVLETHNEKRGIRIIFEYFVSPYFTGEGYWVFANESIVSGNSCTRLQNRGDEIEVMNMSTNANLDGYLIDNPVVSDKTILFCYEGYYNTGQSRKLKLMPHFISPILAVVPQFQLYSTIAEFYFCCNSTKEEYIVYISRGYYMEHIQFDFYKSNGTHVYCKKLKFEGLQGYEHAYMDIKVSPNGKFIFMKVKSNDDPEIKQVETEVAKDGGSNKKKNRLTDRDFFETYGEVKDGVIYEIVMLRRSSTIRKVGKSVQKFMVNSKERITINDIKPKFENEDVIFDLKITRIFKNINKYFGDNTPSVTSIGTLVSTPYDYNKGCTRLLYETFDLSNFIEGKLGVDDKTYEKYKISNFQWVLCSPGFIGYKDDRAVFVKVDVSIGKTEEMVHNPVTNKGEVIEVMTILPKPSKVVQIDFILGSTELELLNVYECKDIRRAVVQISNRNTSEHVFVVWDLENNGELCNYSMKGEFRFAQGFSSEAGYILTANSYINLDNGIANPFFDHNFVASNYSYSVLSASGGYKINAKEDAILDNGNIILKTTYSEIQSLSYYLQRYSTIKEGNFTFFNIKFQLEGNTALHLFALDEEVLKLILEYYHQNKQEYLCSIVMKNFEGKTPLDITIEHDSPRCTNLLLTYLCNFRDGNFSRQIYQIFPTLLERGLKSFHDFLDTCLYICFKKLKQTININ